MEIYRSIFMAFIGILLTETPVGCDSNSGLKITRQPSTGTVLQHHRFSFHCKAMGDPPPKIKWFHNNKEMYREGTNYRITRKFGHLRFTDVDVIDRGEYRCRAENQKDPPVNSKTVTLTVHVPAEIIDFTTDKVLEYGTLLTLTCEAAGIPIPTLQWKKNDQVIHKEIPAEDNRSYVNITTPPIVKSKYTINVTEVARYVCEATNHHIGGTKTDRKTARIYLLADNTGSSSPNGHCAEYNGTICRDILGSQPVFYNTSYYNNTYHMNEDIVVRLLKEMKEKRLFDSMCKVPAKKLLCHYAFPDCDNIGDPTPPYPLCRESCLAVKDLLCYKQWNLILENKTDGIYFRNRAHFRLPNCQELPSMWDSASKCTDGHLFEKRLDEVSNECYKGKGQWYNGTVNVTKSGLACQRWDHQHPQTHQRPPEVFLDLQNSENYCRNPGEEESQPWCYTMDKLHRWELCAIPKCDTSTTTERAEINNPLTAEPFQLKTIIIIFIVSAVAIFIIVLVVILCYKLCVQNNNQFNYDPTPQEDLEIHISKLPQNSLYHRVKDKPKLNPKLEGLEFPRNDVVYIRDIGQGAFGRVFKAKAPELVKGEDFTMVAVKMLKEDASDDLQSDFEREASLLVEFNHTNIVKLLGVCAVGKPMCLLFEYMSKGDLNEFLRFCSPDHFIIHSHSRDIYSHEYSTLDSVNQLYIAKQIASGMVYLSEKGFVHRDLASRNCLVGDDLKVKISDFGLARTIHSMDYYRGSENDAIPIRWMPLEAILYNKFSVKSDIWSFGVVLWEIFAFAIQPYYGMTHEEVVKFVKEGKHLACPENTPKPIYDVMKTCWCRKPSERPTFRTLQKSLSSMYEEYHKQKLAEDI
ncbi:hypothetical protein SNE40_011609 [Patella caerulea]|uniref:receptor protein-tyrosine kinase n=1 Tax=Patella caerulea TaxID=87958 RepID=A0AAN8JNT9_PATCE